MPIDAESIANFRRGAVQDSFLGIVDTVTNAMYLSLAQRQDGRAIDRERYSMIGGTTRDPLPGAGGHATLAGWAGIQAQQVGVGNAVGNAFGFSLVKTGTTTFSVGTFRSGFNRQQVGARPGFAIGTDNEERTLPEPVIWTTLLPELTAGLAGTRARRGSI